jgi:hypothetical protein
MHNFKVISVKKSHFVYKKQNKTKHIFGQIVKKQNYFDAKKQNVNI